MSPFTFRASSRVVLTALVMWVLSVPLLPASNAARSKNDGPDSEIYSLTVRLAEKGTLVEWRSNLSDDHFGFNVYRIEQDRKIKLNREIIPGGVFLTVNSAQRLGRAFAFLDPDGTTDSVYVVESLKTTGTRFVSESTRADGAAPSVKSSLDGSIYSAAGNPTTENQFSYVPAVPKDSSAGTLEDQWAIAGQTALKVDIKRDGWYRVTHAQAVAAGFNPVVDMRNLRLFVDGREVAMLTSKGGGQFVSGDYVEFFGRGLDIATSGLRTYYLIAGSQPGKRVLGELHTTSGVPTPAPTNNAQPVPVFARPSSRAFNFLLAFIFGYNVDEPVVTPSERPITATPTSPARRTSAKQRRKKEKRQYSHAVSSAASVSNFTYTVERKDRLIYFSSLLNGDTENYFGQVLSCSGACLPLTQSLNVPNPDTSATGFARLEIALQGVGTVQHQVDVSINNSAPLGTLSYFGLGHAVQTFQIPVSMLINGSNSISFASKIAGTVSIVDYVRLTYPHTLRADNNSLRLSVRPTQSLRLEGFTTQNIRIIDVTDPFSVKISTPVAEPSAGAFAIQIGSAASTGKSRVVYAQPDSQFETPESLSLNEPSSLNSTANAADLLIIAHKNVINTVTPLVTLRQSQGSIVTVANVEDVYDEFSYGVHGPQAIKSFLSRAALSWSRAPRYVLLLGDASLDPRNYQGFGELDMVPTKLVDATFNETAADDWLSDFNDDGLPEIPIGRLPVRNVAQADLVISKITSFAPAAVPQSALLIADDPTGYYFNFEEANDQVEALLPVSMTVQRVNKRTEPDARTRVISNFNSGQALVNYTGHGNVDTWMGSSVFNSNDAAKLTNAVSVVISQIYSGGGEAGASLRNDYVELFNRGAWPARLGGWSIQYAAAAGSTWQVTQLPDVVIPPGKYFLIQLAQGPGGSTGLPAPDAQGTTDLDSTGGKIALLNTTSALSGTGCPASVNVVDLVGYGAANCSLGNPVAALTTTTAALRGNSGCADTRMNSADFSAGTPAPRNSATAANICINASSRLPLSFVVVMDCLNGYFQDPVLQGLAESLINAPNGGAVAVFASSGLTVPDGQHAMATQLYTLLYGSQSIPLGDAVKTAKAATTDIDVRRTWILFGDPSMKIR